MAKNRSTRLTFAILLLYFRENGSFPPEGYEVGIETIQHLCLQIDMDPLPPLRKAIPASRTVKRLRAEVRAKFGFREVTLEDLRILAPWLCDQVAPEVGDATLMKEQLIAKCRELFIKPYAPVHMERIVRTALTTHDERFYRSTHLRLDEAAREKLDALLRPKNDDGDEVSIASQDSKAPAVLLQLRESPGRPGLNSMQDERAKLNLIRAVGLPPDLFAHASGCDLERFTRRASTEAPFELRRHPPAQRITLLAVYVHTRARSITDNLVDLLIETVHHIGAHAERKVERELLNDLKLRSPGLFLSEVFDGLWPYSSRLFLVCKPFYGFVIYARCEFWEGTDA